MEENDSPIPRNMLSIKPAFFSFETCPVKVSFTDCPSEERKIFFKSNCIMPISVGLGLKVHEESKFLGTIKLINSAFKNFTVLLDDSIQRHTMRILDDSSEQEIYFKAIREGDLWLQRNECIISLATIPYRIIRWDDWLNHDNYVHYRSTVESLFRSDRDYRNSFEETIKEFLERFNKNISDNDRFRFDYKYAYESCLLYLKEECSVMCLWAEAHYDFEVYPTGRNKAMIDTYNKIIKNYFPDYLKSVSLHFRKYKPSFLRQNFGNIISSDLI